MYSEVHSLNPAAVPHHVYWCKTGTVLFIFIPFTSRILVYFAYQNRTEQLSYTTNTDVYHDAFLHLQQTSALLFYIPRHNYSVTYRDPSLFGRRKMDLEKKGQTTGFELVLSLNFKRRRMNDVKKRIQSMPCTGICKTDG